MGNVEAMEVILLEPWMGFPIGMKRNLIKLKAEDLIKHGVAEPANKPKPTRKQQPAAKNRAVLSTETN